MKIAFFHFADVTLWSSNGTSVDMLLKQPSLMGATRLLSGANVSYAILIDDLQRNIDEENPPPDVIQQLQNRKGELSGLKRIRRQETTRDC